MSGSRDSRYTISYDDYFSVDCHYPKENTLIRRAVVGAPTLSESNKLKELEQMDDQDLGIFGG